MNLKYHLMKNVSSVSRVGHKSTIGLHAGLDAIEDDECDGAIKQVNVVKNGHAMSFDAQATQSSSKKRHSHSY